MLTRNTFNETHRHNWHHPYKIYLSPDLIFSAGILWTGKCPVCSRPGFAVNDFVGSAHCASCGATGNFLQIFGMTYGLSPKHSLGEQKIMKRIEARIAEANEKE